MKLQDEIKRAEEFLSRPFGSRLPVPVLRSPRGRLVAFRHPADGKVGWNIDLYDVTDRIPTHATLAALLLAMDDRMKAVGAFTYNQRRLQKKLDQIINNPGARESHL